jgi:hypothetical protein
MFHLLLRARAHNLLKHRFRPEFRARSAARDAETDRARIEAVITAVEKALIAAELEHSGLTRRVEDVLARAAVTFGNGDDEYLDREPLDGYHHDLFDKEIQEGQRRLKELTASISHLKFLRSAAGSRFSEHLVNA